MRIKSILCLCLLSLLTAGGVFAQVQTRGAYPKREFRAAWIQSVNGQFRGMPAEKLKQNLTGQLNSLQKAGINAIIFQVRPEADALYASRLEPWSRFLTGVQGKAPEPYWDPMQFMIDECHKRGMEFHAWINPYRTKTTLKSELAPNHVYNIHPEWFVTYGDQLYFDPALPESRRHICMVVSDIVSRYDVDAIHMDDYFYPYPVKGKDFPDDASFARLGGGFGNKGDWRRNNVNMLIKKLHETIREIKPWVKFGVSPFGIYRNESSDPLGSKTKGLQNYDDLYADVLLWAREGWIDYNIPQIYWHIGHPAADYETLVKWWARHTENRPLFIGQSVMNTVQNADPKNPSMNQLPRKMALQRAYQTIGGSCQWPASAVIENVGKYRDALIAEYHKYPALPPVFDFMDNEAPAKVRRLKPVWTEDGYILFWTAPKYEEEMNRAVRYVVYRFGAKEAVDIDDPSHIVAITRDNFYKLPYEDGKTKYRYVVTALDRLHNESKSVGKKIKL
ncbi:family 10 glycosylhydrolase [uncultured Bacteroides sp.]|uniref:glycoside hydrolase family 10 protein n=2 Tax=uncultured Bacteroides sp. TaxID=162156 RepID=UPI0025938CBA|nr:family 10 glycosylhydrolase [uncultured Bacteroides sp.]